MDFLDPKKQKQQRWTLLIGYALISLAIGFGTLILLYEAFGFSVDNKGQVIQSGLVFASSQPNGANIYLDNKPFQGQTNSRMVLPSGTYQLKLSLSGYRDWQHQIVVAGGDVQHYDYPFLFPTSLKTTSVTTVTQAPQFSSQSPDHRWLLIKPADNPAAITMYDLKNPLTPVASSLTIPSSVMTAGDGADSWKAVEWSTDNKQVLLLHTYVTATVTSHEYIMFNRSAPDSSVNITKALTVIDAEVPSLFNKKANQFYLFDATAETLRTASTDGSITVQKLEHVVAYKPYGDNMLLYATTVGPTGKTTDVGKVSVVLQQDQKTYTLRTLQAGATNYDLDFAQYSGDWYVLIGSNKDDGVYIYKNPQATTGTALPSPWRLLRLANTTRVSFSSNAQYILAEAGQQFVVYDAENVRTYRFTTTQQIDPPQTYAAWMDGSRLTYVSGGKQVVFDYDYTNIQSLQPALPAFAPSFDPTYQYVFSFAPASLSQPGAVDQLSRTALIAQ